MEDTMYDFLEVVDKMAFLRFAKENQDVKNIRKKSVLLRVLSFDNSSSRPPEERNSENVDTIIESPSPSPIPVEDSDSHMEEIDLFLAFDDSMPPGIENDDYDSEGDIRFLEELLSNDPLPLPEIESSNLDHFNDPSSPRPPPEPPDVEICFDVEPDTTVKNNFDKLNEDECFDPGGEIDHVANGLNQDDYFLHIYHSRILSPVSSYLGFPFFSPPGVKTPFLTRISLRAVASHWEELSALMFTHKQLMKARLRLSLPFAFPNGQT
ncbi:hypothetical protein Tco_0183388 [Tanacetum coccineum]